ncbi:MAG: LacI family DNA-binding transcriptional regulator [Gordonia paraffinivorans]
MRDVATAAGVSLGTVSNVLNAPEKVASTTVERVHAAIDELGFVRNDAARQLRAGRSRSVGLVVLDIGNPFFTDIAHAATGRAREHDLTVLLGTSGDDPRIERAFIDAFDEQRVHGLLLSPVGELPERLHRLRRRGTPVVLVDRDGRGTPFHSVAVDDVAGATLAVAHLCDVGRRAIAFVGGPSGLRQVRDRRQGAEEVVGRHPGARLEVIETPALSVLAGRAVGDALLRRPPATRPDAVFCANDLLAIGLLQALTMTGDLRVPDDIALIGYDDIEFASSTVVPLSSVRQPTGAIGSAAVDLLVETRADVDAEEPTHVLFTPELVARRSTTG